ENDTAIIWIIGNRISATMMSMNRYRMASNGLNRILRLVVNMVLPSFRSEQAGVRELFGEVVGGSKQHKVDDRTEQADGRRIAHIARDKALPVHIGRDDIRSFVDGRRIEQQDLFKADFQDRTDAQDQHGGDGWRDAGQRN